MSKRDCHVMLRLSPEEHAALAGAKPPGEDLASFARRLLLAALAPPQEATPIREVAAFVVAALSSEIGFDEAARLYDDHVRPHSGGTNRVQGQ